MVNVSRRRTLLVTGASRGLGRAIARQFAAEGYRVAVHCATNRTAAASCVAELPGNGHVIVQGSVEWPQAARNVFAEAAGSLQQIDVLVNNAGIYEEHPPVTSSEETWTNAWQKHLGVNLLGPACLCHAAIAHMRQHGGGSIINVSSRGAYRGEPTAPAYGATKAALNSLTQSLAAACAPHQIYVFGIAPGWIDTDMAAPYLQSGRDDIVRQSPLGRVATPDEIARIAVFLAAPEASWMTGSIVDANGASYFH